MRLVSDDSAYSLFPVVLVLRTAGRLRLPRLRVHLLLPLHLLHLLGCAPAGREAGANGRRVLRLWLLRLLFRVGVLIAAGRRGSGGWLRAPSVAGTEHDPARSSLALVSDHHYVIAGAEQKLAKHIARRAGAESAKNALVGVESFQLCAGEGGYVHQNLFQAGVGGVDAQALAVPRDRSLRRLFVGRPLRQFRRGRSCRNGSSRRRRGGRWSCICAPQRAAASSASGAKTRSPRTPGETGELCGLGVRMKTDPGSRQSSVAALLYKTTSGPRTLTTAPARPG